MVNRNVMIVGAGSGLSASLARLFVSEGMNVALVARNIRKLDGLCKETGARSFACDARIPIDVTNLFESVCDAFGDIETVIYNARAYARGGAVDATPESIAENFSISAMGAFLISRAATKRMLESGGGNILLTGATASVKGNAGSIPFAMGKFALRGLAQCLARELGPRNIHVCHFIMDGMFRTPENSPVGDTSDSTMAPDEIARVYLDVMRQHRSAWASEMDLRPWAERF